MQQSQVAPSLFAVDRPNCPKCGTRMDLARIEPDKPDHDLRTFECTACAHVETVVTRYR